MEIERRVKLWLIYSPIFFPCVFEKNIDKKLIIIGYILNISFDIEGSEIAWQFAPWSPFNSRFQCYLISGYT